MIVEKPNLYEKLLCKPEANLNKLSTVINNFRYHTNVTEIKQNFFNFFTEKEKFFVQTGKCR